MSTQRRVADFVIFSGQSVGRAYKDAAAVVYSQRRSGDRQRDDGKQADV